MLKKFFRFLFKTVLWFVVVSIALVVLFRWVPVSATPLMAIRYFEQKKEDKNRVFKHDWVPLEKISKNLQLAVICSEDQNFVIHNGFDMKAIEKAMEHNKKGKKVRGASTISQQTAKNVFLWPQRSWFRKGLET
ncbi:MAG TPA: transglycosylase domain-containing protein, partial [Mangrovimonas sp.]|nr:transglycosylase domain-containing protein [Mangrovimonas sp.]